MEEKRWTLQSVGTILEIHISKDLERDKKTDAMYEILVTGNGAPALPETVRIHEAWINEQKKESEESSRRNFEYKKGIIILAIGQIVTLLVGAAAILKR